MSKSLILSLALFAMVGPAALADCGAKVSPVTLAGTAYTAEAVVIGEDCATAVALLVLRDAEGGPVYTFAAPTGLVFDLQWSDTSVAMQDGLTNWVGDGSVRTTAELPDWPAEQEFPESEFGFVPEAWLDQSAYSEVRNSGLPLWCYTQGLESMGCLALTEEYIDYIGYERFPG